LTKRIAAALATLVLALNAIPCRALPGTFMIDQIYSNGDGSVQFLVVRDHGQTDCDASENRWTGEVLISRGAGPVQRYVFQTDLPTCHTSGKRMLIATQSFAALGLVAADYVIPDHFIQIPAGALNFASVSDLSYSALPNDGVHAIDGNGATMVNVAANLTGASASVTPSSFVATAIEYYHAAFGHYFLTPNAEEIAKLDAGVFSGWARTGESFNVYVAGGAGVAPVCRFFTVAFPPTSSHFYAPRGLGCEGTLANPDWQFEGDVFHASLPDVGGACPAGTVAVYRLYNNGQGGAPNHRFTVSDAIRVQMLARGYIAEGSGIGVGMCSPT
jgi:hypothetical protein